MHSRVNIAKHFQIMKNEDYVNEIWQWKVFKIKGLFEWKTCALTCVNILMQM